MTGLAEELLHEQAEPDRREMRRITAALAARDAELADLRRKLDLVTAIDQAKLRPPRWLLPPRRTAKHATACAMLTDTHFGEVVEPAEVEWLNAFNDEIAEQRLRRFGEKAVRLTRDYISGVELDGGVLFLGGDIFTGTIHDELLETNSETLYASVIHWIEPLLATVTMLAEAWGGKLHCAATFGNHGRRTRKPRAKQRAQDNIEWLFYKVMQRETRHLPGVTWQIPDSADTHVSVYGTRYLLTHGDQFRGGSGIAGALSPLMLGQHRKARRAMSAGRPYDVLVMGHFHQYLTLPGLIVGGTLKGLDEYAYLGNFGYEPAQQALWITTPDHGITITAPIHVEDRVAEGWAAA